MIVSTNDSLTRAYFIILQAKEITKEKVFPKACKFREKIISFHKNKKDSVNNEYLKITIMKAAFNDNQP